MVSKRNIVVSEDKIRKLLRVGKISVIVNKNEAANFRKRNDRRSSHVPDASSSTSGISTAPFTDETILCGILHFLPLLVL
ncbi:hypothetical protein J6590_055727 [Homalodisca vitripennis]|nr:hypothetical protein J6590_055727 [Homalodisca vitripennis]